VIELSVEAASWLGSADFSVAILGGWRRRAVSRRRGSRTSHEDCQRIMMRPGEIRNARKSTRLDQGRCGGDLYLSVGLHGGELL
jgi:hypothetical protein